MSDQPGAVDGVNRPLWSAAAEQFVVEGWLDPGELASLLFVADRVRGGRVLDIGVGAGRTVPLLLLLSADYVGVDYTPELVELCRARYPGVDVRPGDARELADLDGGSVSLVTFSSNGIDAVDHDDRQRVLASVHRVLRPGGLFLFSTLNKDGPLYGASPADAPDTAWLPGSLLPRPASAPADADVGGSADADDPAWVRAVRNWRRLQPLSVDADGWGMAPFAAHEFGLVTHFVTVDTAAAELDRHGFDVQAVFPCDARRPLEPGERTSALYVHLVAARRDGGEVRPRGSG